MTLFLFEEIYLSFLPISLSIFILSLCYTVVRTTDDIQIANSLLKDSVIIYSRHMVCHNNWIMQEKVEEINFNRWGLMILENVLHLSQRWDKHLYNPLCETNIYFTSLDY